ncbi:nitric oxide dioxygenase [Aggregicoccus sp. 17bor-14]|nr:nitric oxide dioxygenase [Simulacricoccus sp. 17bor-14]MRI87350.1 nitric oxide dioxygenase [Aggregicoccus sp. 17bor-14]
MTEAQRSTLKRTWELAEPVADTVADLFYRRLFELAPQYQGLFSPDLEKQKRKLVGMLRFVVRSLDWSDAQWKDPVASDSDLFLVMLALGRRHTELYRVPDEAYATVGEALLWTLDYGLGEAFTPEAREAWTRAYGLISMTMKMARTSTVQRDLIPSGSKA